MKLSRFGLVFFLSTLLVYGITFFVSSEREYSKDKQLTSPLPIADSYSGLDLYTNQADIQNGILRITAIPRLSNDLGENTSNGAFLQVPVTFSFDVFEGNTSVNPGAGQLISAQDLALRLSGSPTNYPFDSYNAQFYASAGIDGYNSAGTSLYIKDKTSSLPGFSVKTHYVSFSKGTIESQDIQSDIKQGTGLISWNLKRSNSTVLAVFLFGALMLIGATSSLLMTVNVLRGRRPPSINTLTWLAAFLFALFQVRNQLPGDPPSGVQFDLFIFFPTILILICLIMINVAIWNEREDWDLENPKNAIRGQIQK